MKTINRIPWKTIVSLMIGIGVCAIIFKAGTASAQWTDWHQYIPGEMQGRTLQDYIRTIIDTALVIASVVAVAYLIVGGYQYITSSGNAEQAQAGRTTVLNAIIGLIIIFAAFVVIRFVMDRVVGFTPSA